MAATMTSRGRQVELVVQQVEALPTLSPIATRLLNLSSSDDTDLKEIVTLIESDPSLTSKILGLCRRADRGITGPITTVRRAVVLLGLEAVQAAVLSVAVYELLSEARHPLDDEEKENGTENRSTRFERVGFWKHSVSVACAAELLARLHPGMGIPPEEGFVAGLLHDLGKLVLELILPRSYARVVELSERRQCAAATVERQVIGLDHHTAGKRLAEHWSLPHALQDVMWLHSQPYETVPDVPHRKLIGLVGAAKALCRELHLGWSGEFGPGPDVGAVCAAAGLDAALARSVGQKLLEAVAERCRALGIDSQSSPQMLLQSVSAANGRLSRMNAALSERSRLSHQQSCVLGSIAAFHGMARPGRTVVDALGDVVRSAAGLMGQGFYAALFQARAGEAWQVCQFSGEGRLLRSEILEPPKGMGQRHSSQLTAHIKAEDTGPVGLDVSCASGVSCELSHGVASLADLADPSQLSMSAVALLPWLTDYLGDAVDLRQVRLMPLYAGSGEDGAGSSRGDGPAAVLLHDRPVTETTINRPQLAALTATWAAAVAAAAQHEGARRLGEELADTNRTLAEAQSRLAETEAMARLGEMAAGAAHEMNNPLTVISGRCQLLAARAGDAEGKSAARAIVGATEKLSDLITSLHLLANPPTPRRGAVGIGDLVRESIDEAVRRVGAGAEGRVGIEWKERSTGGTPVPPVVPAPLPPARVDRELVVKALTEIVANALEASDRGFVEVRVHIDPLDDRLMISVADHGPGMSAKALQHAFDPFFSEKAAGRQTGLGLTRARRMIELHGGSITLRSEPEGPERGTAVTVSLPDWRCERREPMAGLTGEARAA
jgi:signal transduction histidine kinase/HD-like signal output (HDOD) protein